MQQDKWLCDWFGRYSLTISTHPRDLDLEHSNLLLLLRSNVGMVMSNLEVGVLDELGSCLKFLLGSPHPLDGHRPL